MHFANFAHFDTILTFFETYRNIFQAKTKHFFCAFRKKVLTLYPNLLFK